MILNCHPAACYVKIRLPKKMVEDLSHRRNHEGQDLWIWPECHGPLVLSQFQHRFGVMEGTEDPYQKGVVMSAARRAYNAISITGAIERIEWDRALSPILREKRIKFMEDNFWKIVERNYFVFDLDPYRDPFTLTQELGLFLCDRASESADSDDSEEFYNSDELYANFMLTCPAMLNVSMSFFL